MRNIIIIVLGSLITAVGFNLFMIPHHILSSGLSGIAMMLGIVDPRKYRDFKSSIKFTFINYRMVKARKAIYHLYHYFCCGHIGWFVVPPHFSNFQ